PAHPQLLASIPLPHRPGQSAHGGTAFQTPAASAATVPTSPPRCPPPSATSAAAELSSPAVRTPPAPGADASGSPASSERLRPKACDSAAACPEIRWRKRPLTEADIQVDLDR